ncbi:hypothetical protein ABLN97_03935 [Mycobacterium tuberculosis]
MKSAGTRFPARPEGSASLVLQDSTNDAQKIYGGRIPRQAMARRRGQHDGIGAAAVGDRELAPWPWPPVPTWVAGASSAP